LVGLVQDFFYIPEKNDNKETHDEQALSTTSAGAVTNIYSKK
jgi:hypothetical protein